SLRLIGWRLHLASWPNGVPRSTAVILFQLRMPRVALAALVGAALAVAGTVFQALFRNPMADPAIIGVSSGAAVGATAVILVGGGWRAWRWRAGGLGTSTSRRSARSAPPSSGWRWNGSSAPRSPPAHCWPPRRSRSPA